MARKASAVKSQKTKSSGVRNSRKKAVFSSRQAKPAPTLKPHKIIDRSSSLLRAWLDKYSRRISFYGGTATVVLWTILRHITNGVNFDVVGQLGIAQQWAHGQMSGAQLGATSYILKIPVYFLINSIHFLTPMNRILLAAIIFNVMTFMLLFVIYEKIIKLYEIKNRSWLYVGMAWLSTIAGNVFWVDYANSRNLETVGGVLFIYLVLKYLKYNRLKTLAGLVITAGVIFFADPIQLYVCGLGAVLFVAGQSMFRPSKASARQALAVSGAVSLGFGLSEVLFFLAKKVLHVTFLVPSAAEPKITMGYLINSIHALGTNTLKIFGSDFFKRPYNFNSVREVLNALVLISLVAIIFRLFIKRRSNIASVLILVIIVTNYLVYLASGQALQWETSRYLIMVPLLVILLLVLRSDELTGKNKLKLQYTWWLLAGISGFILLGALAYNWPARHSKDTHIQSLVTFMDQKKFTYALSSRETGVTTTYFSQGNAVVLPMACEADHTLHPTNLFYDKAAFSGIYNYRHNIPIIIPPGGIKYGKNVCTSNNIFGQFGAPRKILNVPDVGLAAVYAPSRILLANFGQITGRSSPFKIKKAALPSIGVDVSPVTTIPKLEGCRNGTTDVVVAHPDDDILFMIPDLSKELVDKCVRSVFVTAGDSGHGQEYWMNRQKGIEAAYAAIVDAPNNWSDNTAIIDNCTILIRTLDGYPALSLVFMILPDGGTGGQGFPATGYSSLEKASRNLTETMQTLDGKSVYTYAEVAKVVGTIIATDNPNKIFTHVGEGPLSIGDHSDHRTVGLLTIQARHLAKSNAELVQYVGYPLNNLPPNLSPEIANQKRNIFDIYASEDAVICVSRGCSIEATYGKYFFRSYKK